MGSNFLVGQVLDDLFTVRGDHSCGVVNLARVDRDLDKGFLYPAEHHAGIVHDTKTVVRAFALRRGWRH